MKNKLIKYGGAVTGIEEERAIIKSIKKSRLSRNWQLAEEGRLFEKELADFVGVKDAILTTSGSSAGLLALSSLELPKGSEVIISAVTFPTIFNIILQCGLVPVVVDANIYTNGFMIDDVKKAITKKTRAIIAIHPLGNPVDMRSLMKLVRKYERNGQKIWVIEDNCDGLGGSLGNKKLGSFGDLSFTSLHAAHIVSTGVGGVVFTKSAKIAKKVRMYRDWGRQANLNESLNKKHSSLPSDYNPRFIYEKIGYNFQMLELQAAMGRVQLRKINEIKRLRQRNFNYLYDRLGRIAHLGLAGWLNKADICWFAFPLFIESSMKRGSLLRWLERHGIETRPMFSGNITRHPAYKNSRYRISGKLRGADFITSQSFWISCHPSLTLKDLRYIVSVFHKYFARYAR